MSYQINATGNRQVTSFYMSKNEELQGAATVEGTEASLQAVTETDEMLEQVVNGDMEPATATTVIKNSEQYMELLEKNGATTSEDDAVEEEQRKEEQKEIYKNLTAEEIAKLKMMQVDLSGASLSDIMGLVTTIRSEAKQQEFQQKIADICDGIDAIKGRVMPKDLKEAIQSMLPDDMDHVKLDSLLDKGFQMDEQQTMYLLKNELELTIDNMYKATYATVSAGASGNAANMSDADFLAMRPQLERLIHESGVENAAIGQDAILEGVRMMLNQDIAISQANIRNYVAIQDINARGIVPEQLLANMLERQSLGDDVANANVYFEGAAQKAEVICESLTEIRYEAVKESIVQGRRLTLHNLSKIQTQLNWKAGQVNKDAENTDVIAEFANRDVMDTASKAEITARRQLEELRLTMTQQAATRLAMKNIHIDTLELSELVDALKQSEQDYTRSLMHSYGVKATKANVSLYQETMHKVEGIRQMPAATLIVALEDAPLTIQSLYEDGMEMQLKQSQATNRYETMMTTPRSDMGDSISKAFANMDSLLSEMQIEATEANKRAVRILGYNQMEITEESLLRIKEADAKVQTMLQEMTPQAVMQLIKDRQNPMDMPLDALNALLKDNRGDKDVVSDERFSEYLYRLDQKGDISEAEKESYIGLFRLLDKINKFSGRDIGTVVRNGQELTLENLLAAHRSNQAKGMTLEASDDKGMTEAVVRKGTSISEQIQAAYGENLVDTILENISPEGIAELGGAQTMETMTLEFISEQLQHTKNQEIEIAYGQNQYEQELPEDMAKLEQMLAEYQIPVSAGNVKAFHTMLANQAGIFDMIRFFRNEDGDDQDIQEMSQTLEDAFTDQEAIEGAYQEIATKAEARVENGVISYMDIQSLKQIHTGMSILRKMSKQEAYQVPVETKAGWSVMTVRFQDSESELANILCTMEHETLGEIRAQLYTGEDGYGSLRSFAAGELEFPQELVDLAKAADTKSKRYELAKKMISELSKL